MRILSRCKKNVNLLEGERGRIERMKAKATGLPWLSIKI